MLLLNFLNGQAAAGTHVSGKLHRTHQEDRVPLQVLLWKYCYDFYFLYLYLVD